MTGYGVKGNYAARSRRTHIAKDLAKGRDRDYTSPDVALQLLQEGMLLGGGMTLYGETLWKAAGVDRMTHHLFFGDSAKYRVPPNRPFELKDVLVGGGVTYAAKAVAGVSKGVWQTLNGDAEAAATFVNTAKSTLPFVGLPGVKPLLDRVVFDHILEMTDPTAIDKAERRWNLRTGGSFFLTD